MLTETKQCYTFPKTLRIRSSCDYRLLAKNSKTLSGKLLYLQAKASSLPTSRLGLTVSKKYGKSCVRNKFKRYIREAFRLSQHDFPKSYSFHVRPCARQEKASFQDYKKEFIELAKILTSS